MAFELVVRRQRSKKSNELEILFGSGHTSSALDLRNSNDRPGRIGRSGRISSDATTLLSTESDPILV